MAATTTNHVEQQHDVVVVVVPLPAQGHLHAAIELSHRISSANIPVYYVSTAAHVRQAQSRAVCWDPLKTTNLNFIDFPVTFEAPPPNPDASIKFPSQLVPAFNSSLQLREPVTDLVNKLASTSRRVVVVHDFLTSWVVQDVPKITNAECYCLHTVSAFLVFSYIWDAARPPVPPEAEVVLKQLPSQDGCTSPEVIEFAIKQINVIQDAGNIYSTSRVIDGMYLDLTEKMSISKDFKNWALGPFNPVNLEFDKKETRHYSLEWLDKQPASSVIFVSFGSTTSLSEDEIRELAIGLEVSQQRFIWVLRDADKGDIFSGEVRKYQLPEGYEKRVSERGLVMRDWAPQLEILGHPSTGGFMSHCGWNSCIESISMGVPIAVWPMHSDQPRNALFIAEGLKIGIPVREWKRRKEVVPAETVEKVVRTLMASPEGEEMKRKATALKEAVKLAVMEGGVTHKEMESFVAHITR
ncbi:zeatin O-glucosyltransferase-like isoform X2 [Solanum tuberosum]|uniref:zeatin O-glucosyltransferase-like isoform X2 n=1 Tax=Solanum tuberosum TaxID=4113 RepID=UPI00073A3587|nr:PREDICTED: zeatin O-glucosyltransferase-like isoform X2 [Solanum tuberosum]